MTDEQTEIALEADRIRVLIDRFWEISEPFFERVNAAIKDVQAALIAQSERTPLKPNDDLNAFIGQALHNMEPR